MRILLFTGKGGVGKTTVAAATAVRAASSGHRTLIMSTDPAHSLADSFDVPLTSRAHQIGLNLWAEQIDAQDRLESNWREIQEYLIARARRHDVPVILNDSLDHAIASALRTRGRSVGAQAFTR